MAVATSGSDSTQFRSDEDIIIILKENKQE
jgi:hypothetical protein